MSLSVKFQIKNKKDNNMKIILADPPKREEKYDLSYPNIGILYLIGTLRQRFQQNIEVLYLQGNCDLEEHLKAVQEFNPNVYGISFATLVSNLAYRTINAIRNENPSLPIICGGAHPTAASEDVMKNSQVDICVLGEGEVAICDLVNYYMNENTKISDIKGIVYRNNGQLIKTEKRPFIRDLNSIPFPAWDTINFDHYLGMHLRKADPQTYVVVSRGCPFNCNFCSNPVWKYNKPWVRMRNAKDVSEEVKLLYGMGVREIYLNADEFNVSIEWAIEVCNEIQKLGYKDLYFQCNVRADKVTEELAKAFLRINLWLVHIGIESGNQKTLDGIGKHITLEQINTACRILKKAIYSNSMYYQHLLVFHNKVRHFLPKHGIA
jgi:radical SAM superfamily enzyme YgiQ (UPF0313 family)